MTEALKMQDAIFSEPGATGGGRATQERLPEKINDGIRHVYLIMSKLRFFDIFCLVLYTGKYGMSVLQEQKTGQVASSK